MDNVAIAPNNTVSMAGANLTHPCASDVDGFLLAAAPPASGSVGAAVEAGIYPPPEVTGRIPAGACGGRDGVGVSVRGSV